MRPLEQSLTLKSNNIITSIARSDSPTLSQMYIDELLTLRPTSMFLRSLSSDQQLVECFTVKAQMKTVLLQ